MTLQTDRAVLLRYTRDGGARRGSGLRIGGTYVLTANHCANGTGHTVVADGRDYPATVALRGQGDVDIAILSAPDLPVLPSLSCARVNTGIADQAQGLYDVGVPDLEPPRRGGLPCSGRRLRGDRGGRQPACGSRWGPSAGVQDHHTGN